MKDSGRVAKKAPLIPMVDLNAVTLSIGSLKHK